MKRKLFSTLVVITLIIASVSCKGDKKNETEAAAAQEVAVITTEATKFMVDKDASQIEWTGFKPTGQHSGILHLDSGVVKVDGDKITGTFLIDMNSISVTDIPVEEEANAKLAGHLKSDDFFNAEVYPTSAFEITGFELKDGKGMLSGNLKMKDVENNITIPVSINDNGDTLTLKSETFTIDRSKWNVKYGSKSFFDDLGDKFINDDFELQITLVANKKS